MKGIFLAAGKGSRLKPITINKFTYVIVKLRNDGKFQGFSPDFASHHPPKGYKKLQNVQGHEIASSFVLWRDSIVTGLDFFNVFYLRF